MHIKGLDQPHTLPAVITWSISVRTRTVHDVQQAQTKYETPAPIKWHSTGEAQLRGCSLYAESRTANAGPSKHEAGSPSHEGTEMPCIRPAGSAAFEKQRLEVLHDHDLLVDQVH